MSSSQGSRHSGGVISSREQVLREQEAALVGLSAALESSEPVLAPASLALALRVIGDGLRLGLALPGALRKWLREVDHGELARSVSTWAAAAESTEGLKDAAPGHLARRQIVQWLDETDSVEMALRRALIPREPAPELATALDALARVGRDARAWVVAHVHKDEATSALGPRIELTSTWLEELASEAATEGAPEKVGLERLSEGLELYDPSEAVIHGYVLQGAFARHVDAAARRSPEFGRKLLAIIEAHREAGEPVSIPAHIRARARVPMSFQQRKAAATSTLPVPPASRELGHLGVIDAEARLTADGPDLVLYVYPETPGAPALAARPATDENLYIRPATVFIDNATEGLGDADDE